jgi:hypothetical protein
MNWLPRGKTLTCAACLVGLVSSVSVGAGSVQGQAPADPDGHRIYLPMAMEGAPAGPTAFDLAVIPEWNHNSIPGQRCVFLVTLRESGAGEPVGLSAAATGATVRVEPEAIAAGDVGEVTVIPDGSSQERTLSITVRGRRGETIVDKTIYLDVLTEAPDQDEEYRSVAAEIRDRFTPWLAEHHPELGITPDTEWSGTIVTPRWLVVSHYLFFSPEWEMHVAWHIMIPPYDWRRIDLRHRWDETKPSYAFEISSWAAGDAPRPIDPPDAIWR